jgi:hypothetical protein
VHTLWRGKNVQKTHNYNTIRPTGGNLIHIVLRITLFCEKTRAPITEGWTFVSTDASEISVKKIFLFSNPIKKHLSENDFNKIMQNFVFFQMLSFGFEEFF